MARVIFFVWPHTASVVSGLKLARDLGARGHEISYIGVAQCKEYVVAHGHQFTPLYEKWFGETPTEASHEIAATRSFWEGLRNARARIHGIRRLLNALASDQEREFQEIMARERPDLLIIHVSDFEVIIPSLLAYDAGIMCAYLYDNFGRSEDSRVPPVRTAILPGNDWWASTKLRLAWKTLKIRRNLIGYFYGSLGLAHLPDLCRTSRQIAERCRYPWKFVESTDLLPLKARFPELVLWPRELEFPHDDRPGRYYLGCGIDLERQEVDFPWNSLDERRIIYCSLGTIPWASKSMYHRFFMAVLAAAENKTEFQWVISLYDAADPEDFLNAPPNVHFLKRAPQLEILRRSAVAIVHGGGNTVKECAYFGVPMVVFPLGLDQPGNAARVVYHGLGVSGDFFTVTAGQLSALLDRVERDSFIQTQARLMGGRLRAADLESPAVVFVEKLLGATHA